MFFFFKQKTAYEMRISDWSSDVCSSDLSLATGGLKLPGPPVRPAEADARRCPDSVRDETSFMSSKANSRRKGAFRGALRSEEHTSELQSLMRISYAVFCLKKKTQENKPKAEQTLATRLCKQQHAKRTKDDKQSTTRNQ